MPNTTDTKILEMRFDNAKFERNIRQSMNSLNELDRALQMKNAGKGFEKLEKMANKSMDFSKMEKSLAFLEYRFSALGMTAAKVIDRTTSKIGGLFSKINAMTVGQIKSGGMARALKLEHANFMLDGILKDAEKVKDIMDNAVSPAVDGTAYGLDAAANAASQFVATGIKDVEKLKTALTGISGVAAMSGSEYEDIARIFTKVAASGRMMGDEVMQLSTRGISAQAELAKYLKKTTAEVQEMQKKGQISFEIFANAMNDAFGEQAKKANDTYTGAMSNLKAALSRIGADFATPYINNMRDIFNALRLTVNDIRKAIHPLVNIWTDGMVGLKNFVEELTKNEKFVNIYKNTIASLCRGIQVLSNLMHPLADGFRKAFPEGLVGIISDVTGRISEFMNRLEFRTSALRDLGDAVGGILSILKLISYAIGQLTSSSRPLVSQINIVLGVAAKILGIIGKYITKSVEMIVNNKKQISIFKMLKTTIAAVIITLIKAVAYIASFIMSLKDMPIVKDIFDGIYDSALSLGNYALPILAGAAAGIANVFKYLIDLGKSGFFSEIFTKVSEKAKGLHDALAAGEGAISSFGNIFRGGFTKLPTTITAFAKSLDNANEVVSASVKPGGFMPGLHKLHEGFSDFSGFLKKTMDDVVSAAKKFGIARGLIVGVGASLLAFLYQAAGMAKNFKKAFAGIPGVISALKNNLNANIFDVKAKAVILGLAVAIGALTLSLVALSLVDSRKLREAAISMSVLVGVLTIAGLAINKFGDGFKGFQAVAFSFISFAGAIAVLSIGLEILANIDLDFGQLMLRVLALGAIMAALGGVVIGITRWSKPFSVLLGSGFMLSFALTIKMLVSSLAVLGEMNIENINRALPALLKMMGQLALIGMACSMLSPFAGLGFIGIVAGISAFILALQGLAEILDPDKFHYIHTLLVDIYNVIKGWLVLLAAIALVKTIQKAVVTISGALGTIKKGITDTTTTLSNMGTNIARALAGPLQAFGNAAVIVSLIGGFVAIAMTIAKIKDIPEDQFLEGCKRAGEIAIGFVGFMGSLMLLQKVLLGKKMFLGGLEKIAFSMATLVASLAMSMKIISEVPNDQIEKALIVVGGFLVLIGVFEVFSAALAKNNKAMQMGIKTALALAVFITALTLAVGLLSMVAEQDWVPVIAAAGAMLLIMGGIAAICFAMSKVEWAPALAASLGIAAVLLSVAASFSIISEITVDDSMITMLISMGLAIAVLSGIFYGLSSLDWKSALVAAGGMVVMTGVFFAFAKIFEILQTIKIEWKVLLQLGASIGFLTGIIVGLGVLSEYVVIGLAVLGGITLIMWGLAKIGTIIDSIDSKKLLDNCKILGVAVGVLALVCGALGAIMMTGYGAVALGLGAAALVVFAAAMAIVAGVGALFASVMTSIANALELFAPALTHLGEALQSFAAADFAGLTANLIGAIEVIGGLALVSNELLLAATGVKALGEGMASLAEYSVDLKTNLDNLDEAVPRFKEHVETLTKAFEDLTTILQNGIEALSDSKIYEVITSLSDAMKQYSEAEFNSLGIIIIQHIISGMSSEIEASVPPIMDDVVSGLRAGLFNAEGEVTAIGAELGRALVDGFRGPEGVDAHSPARKFIDAALDCVGGLVQGSKEGESDIMDAGAAMGQALEEGCRGPNGVDAHSNSWKFIAIAKDCIGGLCAPFFGEGKKDIEKAGAEGGSTLVDSTTDKIKEKAPEFVDAISGLHDQAQKFLNGNPLIQEITTVLNDPTGLLSGSGLTERQRAGAAAEDKKRSDMFGYNSIEALTKAGQAGQLKTKWSHKAKVDTNAINDETKALNKNSGAAGKNTKAKEANEKANDGKTKAIDEETESLGAEEEAVDSNSEAIREMAEEIEVVTEKYNELNATQGFRDKFKIAKKSLMLMGDAFHTAFRSTIKDANGIETTIKKTYSQVSQIFNSTRENTKKTTEAIAKGLYAFDAATGKYDRKLTKKLQNGSKTAKNAEKQAIKTGKVIAKVYEGYAKIFSKNGNGVDKMTIRLTKNIKNLGKYFGEASNFVKSFNTNIHEAQYVEDFTSNLRNIEKFFYKRQNMPQKVQDYLGDILSQFKGDFKDSMNILAKSIDGIGDYWNKGAQNTAYVADSMVQLAAALYDGSDAANEYWTQIARLEFLYENGEATLEELEEAKRPYLERAIETLKEYYQTLTDTIGSQFDPFAEFDKKVSDSTKNLLKAIRSQIVGFNNWGDMMVTLSQRGADFNLMKQLAEQGVESYGIVENLVTMTGSQLALYNKYYRMMDSVKKKATDSALAAMANARTMASLRAAAESGTISEKQQEKQRNLAKRMTDDIKSVANAQAYYNNMSKKQERDYIKTLDKKGKAEYKAQLKAAKAAKALNDKIAAEEEARLAEENRIDTILETVKGYESLISVINQYSNDAGVMTKINEKLNKSLNQVYKYAGNDKNTTLAWLDFGKVLGVNEEDSENAESYLSSLSSAINNFMDGLKSALFDVKSLFSKFVEATEKMNVDKMFTNASSVVRASRQFGDYIQKLADLGYDQKAINYFVSKFESDKANALAEMEALLNGDLQRNKTLFEYAINAGDKIKEKAMAQAARAVTESAKKDKQQAYNLAKAEAESAERLVAGMQRGSHEYQNTLEHMLGDSSSKTFDKENELREAIHRFIQESGGGVETKKLDQFISESYKKYASDFAEELNNIKKIQGGSIDQRVQAIRRLLDQSPLYKEIYEAQAREYENSKKNLEESINRFHQMEATQPYNIQMEDIIRFEEATKALNKLNEEYKKSIPYIYNQAQAEVKAEFDKAKASAEAKKKAATARKGELEAIEKQLQAYNKEAEMLMTYDDALYEVQRKLKDMGETYDYFTYAIKQAGWSTNFLRKACETFRTALLPVNNALSYARARFSEWAKGSAAVLVNLDKMDEGFLKFASTLDKTNNESGNFMEDLGARLEEYRKSLDSTIRGQIQLFDTFKKYSGEEATSANTYLDNMISQTEGLEQWLNNLEILAKRGVAKEVLQMFASEGQNSFEKVEAFANASNEQLAELNKRYKDYAGLAAEAADRALAAVAASYTSGAEAMQERLVNSFKERAKDQIEESAYEAATMVVTGVKNGLNNAKPQIVAEIDGVATAITNTVSKTLTAKEIEESIRKGLETMSGALQNTVGVVVSDFLNSVTQTSVNKFKMAVDQCRNYIQQNLPTDLTITIHVNSSEMDDAIARMNAAINGTNVVANRTSVSVSQSQANQKNQQTEAVISTPANNTTVNYTQNNYSPTALSRTEIYRQTQNQLSTIRGVVSAS